MKIRKGFVTNSSSSSFIVAYKKPPKLPKRLLDNHPELVFFETFARKTLEDSDYRSYEDERTVARDMDDLEYLIKEFYDHNDNESLASLFMKHPEAKGLYDKMAACIKAKKTVVAGKIPYSSTAQRKLLEGLVKAGMVEEILEIED